MEAPKTVEYPKIYDTLKSFASEHMPLREKNNKNPDLELRYPEIFTGNEGKVDYSLQLSDPMKDKKDLITVGDKQIQVVARFWKSEKGAGENGGSSVCYDLGADGKWYMLTSDTPKYDSEKDTTFWTQNPPVEIDQNVVKVEITDVINRLKKETK